MFKCFNNGKLENFGNPYDLLTGERNTILRQLLNALGKSEASRLIELAKVAKSKNEKTKNSESCAISYEVVEESGNEKEAFLKKNLSLNSFNGK